MGRGREGREGWEKGVSEGTGREEEKEGGSDEHSENVSEDCDTEESLED